MTVKSEIWQEYTIYTPLPGEHCTKIRVKTTQDSQKEKPFPRIVMDNCG